MANEFWERIGVKPIINASATQTCYGGSLMNRKAAEALDEASKKFFDIRELHEAVSKRIAELTRNEDAMVSAGVASAFYLVTMALLKLDDPSFYKKIPSEFPKGKSVILYKSHRVEYVCGIEQAGVSLREIGDVGEDTDPHAEKLEAEIRKNKPLAFLYVMAGLWIPKGAPSLSEAVRVCKRNGVPIIVDAAAQLPPKSNFWEFTQGYGADVVLFSGGKDLCGPCHTGLILGKKNIVSVCRSIISPQDGVGRFFKIGKEELAAVLVAVEEYIERDEEERLKWCEGEVKKIVDGLDGLHGVSCCRAFPNEAGQPIPRAQITFDQSIYPVSPDEVVQDFLNNKTRIAFLPYPGKGFYCNPMTLVPGEIEIIIKEIRSYFCGKKRCSE